MSYTGEFHSGWSKRASRLNATVEIDGVRTTVRERMHRLGLNSKTIYKRVKRGMTLAEAVSVGPMVGHERANAETAARVEWNGALRTYAELARIAGLPKGTIYHRIRKYGVAVAMRLPKSAGGRRLDGTQKTYVPRKDAMQTVSRRLGGCAELVRQRLLLGWTRDEATRVPAQTHGGLSKHWRARQTREQLAGLGIVAT